MACVGDYVTFLERLAPPELAESWDNVGLLVGDRSRPVTRVMTCLTLTPDVAAEAISEQVGLVVTHHPVLFRPVQRLTADDSQGRMLLELIAAGVAVYSPHTGYDSAAQGINRQLAELLELVEIAPLKPAPAPAVCKVVCFVPRDSLAAVQEAAWRAGAGIIGEYARCSFVLEGTGTFQGSAASQPAVGQPGRLEQVAEARLEVICPEERLGEVLRRMRAEHPYEEPAIDVYPLKSDRSGRGAGCTGLVLEDRVTLRKLLELVRSRLGAPTIQFSGDPEQCVSRVGICCGAGGELLSAAIARRCDVFLTGEARFHAALEARTAGMALILAGHYATERPAMERLAQRLTAEFPGDTIRVSRREQDPLQFWPT